MKYDRSKGFDSKGEEIVYKDLKILKASGVVLDFSFHPGPFTCADAYKPDPKNSISARKYTPDFAVELLNGNYILIDIKSWGTLCKGKGDAFLHKRDMLYHREGLYTYVVIIQENFTTWLGKNGEATIEALTDGKYVDPCTKVKGEKCVQLIKNEYPELVQQGFVRKWLGNGRKKKSMMTGASKAPETKKKKKGKK